MSAREATPLQLPEGAPETRLLDARAAGVDEPGLRAWARELADAAGAPFRSRSYRHPYALVAWHDEPVGIDIERIGPVDGAFLESICTPSELKLPVSAAGAEVHATSLWSSKEALAKALGDALRYDPRRLDSPIFWRDGRSGPWRAVSLPVPSGHNAWLCWRSTASPARSSDAA